MAAITSRPADYDYRVRYTLDGANKEQWFYTLATAREFEQILINGFKATNVKVKKVQV